MTLARRQPLLLILPCLMLMSGCMKVKTVVKVQPDGSGTIEETIGLRPAMFKMLAGMFGASSSNDSEIGYLPIDDFKKKASQYGQVTFVGISKVERDGIRYTTGRYSFRDINKVKVPMNEGEKTPGNEKPPSEFIRFEFTRTAASPKLTILLPPPTLNEDDGNDDEDQGTAQPGTGQMSPEQMAMFKQMLGDLEMVTIVECGAAITQTNAQYHEGNRVTLLNMNFAKVLDNADKLAELQKVGRPGNLDQVKELLKDVEGMQIEFGPRVEVEFQ